MDENKSRTLKFHIDELREAAAWKETFCGQQQDKARFFITLLSTLMFVVGLSLNNIPPQKYLMVPCATSFLVCFVAAFWSMYYFAKVIEPRFFHGRDDGVRARGDEDEETLLTIAEQQAKSQNKCLDGIIDLQARYLRMGVSTFALFNAIFGVALIVSRLSWFLPE